MLGVIEDLVTSCVSPASYNSRYAINSGGYSLALAVLMLVILLSAACTGSGTTNGNTGGPLTDLQDIEQAKTTFNQDERAVRLVLLLSATRPS